MIKLIILLVILFIGLLFGHTLIGVEGRVIIALPETVIETSIVSTIIIIAFAVILFWLLEWAFKRVFRTIAGSKNWFGAFSRRQQTNSFFHSINAMLINEPAEARKHISKTMGGDFQGTNTLIAAELANQAGDIEQAQAFLIQAADEPKTHDIAIIKQAEIALAKQQPQEAMDLLVTITSKTRTLKAFVILKLKILAALNDWPQIQSLAATHKKLLADDYIVWASQCVQGEFAAIASKQGARALQQHWESLSRSQRKDEANQAVYVQLLINQGFYTDAEAELVKFAGKNPQSTHYALFKQLKLANPALSVRYIEGEVKKQPTNPQLVSVLGHLAFNSGDLELAQKAIRRALELKDNKEDKALLAKILEQSKDFEGANALYQGLISH